MTSPVKTLLTAAVLLTLVLGTEPARASQGEGYLTLQLGYLPVESAAAGWLHAPALTLGGGWHLSDFALLEWTLNYGATYGADAFRNLASVEMAFRLLIDATQWVPSIGPAVGWLAGYDSPDGFQQVGYVGASACMEYRAWRDHSWALCGTAAAAPYQDDYTSLYLVGFRVNGFLPYLFDR